MSANVKVDCKTIGCSTGVHYPRRANARSDINKNKWLQKYSCHLLRLWLQWQTPLGIAGAYSEQIKEDLAIFYEDPLKRMFIEATYC
jgi:hypothetical protein